MHRYTAWNAAMATTAAQASVSTGDFHDSVRVEVRMARKVL